MEGLLNIKIDEFNARGFVRDVLNYCRRELNDTDILWWIDGQKENEILEFDSQDCLENQFLDYLKSEGKKLCIPFFVKGEGLEYGQAISLNGEVIDLEKEQSVGIEIEHLNGYFVIKSMIESDLDRESNLSKKLDNSIVGLFDNYICA